MIARLGSALALGMVLVLTSGNTARSADEGEQPGRRQFIEKFGAGQLVPPEVQEKLQLSADQKEKISQLQKELEEKTKEAREKFKTAFQNNDKEAVREQLQQLRAATEKLRTELQGKVGGVLNEEQKKKVEEARKNLPQGPGGFGRPGFGGRDGIGMGGKGALLLPQVQERLNLSAEQKEKIAQIQKEMETKLQEVLTDEQKKKLEEMSKAAPAPGRPPFRRPPQPENKENK